MPDNAHIAIGNATLNLLFDKDGHRSVQYKGVKYHILLDLIKACPELSYPSDNPASLAKIAAHLLFGEKVKLIEDSEAYLEHYWETVGRVAANPEIMPPEIATLWLVPLSVFQVVEPTISGDVLTCYMEEIRTGLPFMLTLKIPVETPMPDFKVTALPQFDGFFTGEFE